MIFNNNERFSQKKRHHKTNPKEIRVKINIQMLIKRDEGKMPYAMLMLNQQNMVTHYNAE